MNQLLFMIPVMITGVVGSFTTHPYLGVAVYYLLAVLRPQFIWQWSLPDVAWSYYVALAAILSTLAWRCGLLQFDDDEDTRLNLGHYSMLAFAAWIMVTYFTARHPDISYPYMIEYLKIFVMYVMGSLALRTIRQLWVIYLMVTLALCYIAYEVNAIYFEKGYMYVYRQGYGGLDNNGAALMLAMGVPLCLYAWDGIVHWSRWIFVLFIPVLVHAVLTSFSRGAMVSLILSLPIYLFRCRRRGQLLALLLGVGFMVPFLAGKEIRERFFSIEQHEMDTSANTRKKSWAIAWQMAQESPFFGFGIRNSNLYTYVYGADLEGRAIHSQFLQIAADSGIVGLGCYVLSIVGFAWCAMRVMRRTKHAEDVDGQCAYTIACGAEGAMIVFCIGGVFLSLETFELPYIVMLLGAQTASVWACRAAK
jgi:probable O-glycosylation ligase (exosortase A-associated)